GRTTYHYAYQPFTASGGNVTWQSGILEGAFDRNVFSNWPTVRSFAGFGELRGGYHAVPMLETETLATLPPGLQIKSAGIGVLGNTPPTNHQHTAAGLAFPDAPNVPFHYFSTVFYLPSDFSASRVTDVSGVHIIDDSMIMFINGVEVYRYNTHRIGSRVRIGAPFGLAYGDDLLAETTGFDQYIGANSDARTRTFNINSDFYGRNTGYMLEGNENVLAHDSASRTNLLSALRPGENILTVIIGDNAENSVDMWFDLGFVIGYSR
ncbi:MAG: hypothetical protein FWB80_14605, partial [Defluviitaleaceae bacterium]|nr:hypothetical protein [Defluviitaleaceae bacterium]